MLSQQNHAGITETAARAYTATGVTLTRTDGRGNTTTIRTLSRIHIFLMASVRNTKRINSIFETYRPDIIYHAAAHKHVPLMEVSPNEAIKNNVFGRCV